MKVNYLAPPHLMQKDKPKQWKDAIKVSFYDE